MKTGNVFWFLTLEKLFDTIFYTVFELDWHSFFWEKILEHIFLLQHRIKYGRLQFFYTDWVDCWGLREMYGFVGGDVRNSVLTAQLFFWCIFVRCPYTILVFWCQNINAHVKNSPKKIFYFKKKKKNFIISQIIRLKLFIGLIKPRRRTTTSKLYPTMWGRLHESNYTIMFGHKPYL